MSNSRTQLPPPLAEAVAHIYNYIGLVDAVTWMNDKAAEDCPPELSSLVAQVSSINFLTQSAVKAVLNHLGIESGSSITADQRFELKRWLSALFSRAASQYKRDLRHLPGCRIPTNPFANQTVLDQLIRRAQKAL